MSLTAGQRLADGANGYRAIALALFDEKRIDIEQKWLDAYELEPYILYQGHSPQAQGCGGAGNQGLSAQETRIHQSETDHRLVEHSTSSLSSRFGLEEVGGETHESLFI